MDKWLSMFSNRNPFLSLFQKKKNNTSGMVWASIAGMMIGAFLFGNKNRSEKRTSQATGISNMLNKIPQMANMKRSTSQATKEPGNEQGHVAPKKNTNAGENLANMFKNIPQLSKMADMPELSKELGITTKSTAPSHQARNNEPNVKEMLDKDPKLAEMAEEITGSPKTKSSTSKKH
ncbi:hypothetical protein [Heyndrickxia acidicola]|uniref:Uncharacterized protein n=1 Tax=Heyndrickxia acidicola TaxID=209389 RepID=A0ABU6MAH5_9BACI|nr:hypothetical protein [Heyndrickxia acidicola]MED1201653.1 hypothetical protein [Heyndrickxia acidicola]